MPEQWIDHEGKLMRGKAHRGEYVEDVADSSPGYLRWMLREVDLDDGDAEVVRSWLARKGELNE